MMLLSSKGSRRLVFRELVSREGLQPAGWDLDTKKKSRHAEVCMQKPEMPINLLCTPQALQKMWGFADMSARLGISTPPLQDVMWRPKETQGGQFLSCRAPSHNQSKAG